MACTVMHWIKNIYYLLVLVINKGKCNWFIMFNVSIKENCNTISDFFSRLVDNKSKLTISGTFVLLPIYWWAESSKLKLKHIKEYRIDVPRCRG